MFQTKLKITSSLFFAFAVLIGGAGGLAYRGQESQPDRAPRAAGEAVKLKFDTERPENGPIPQGDQAELQGRWRLVRCKEDGKAQKIVPAELKVAGDKILIPSLLGEAEYTFKLGTTKDPKRIDLIGTGAVDDKERSEGIFQLKGNALTLCVAPSGKERPKEFVSKPGSGHRLAVFEREPAAKETGIQSKREFIDAGTIECKLETVHGKQSNGNFLLLNSTEVKVQPKPGLVRPGVEFIDAGTIERKLETVHGKQSNGNFLLLNSTEVKVQPKPGHIRPRVEFIDAGTIERKFGTAETSGQPENSCCSKKSEVPDAAL